MTALREYSQIASLSKLCQLLLKVHKELFTNHSTAVESVENRKK